MEVTVAENFQQLEKSATPFMPPIAFDSPGASPQTHRDMGFRLSRRIGKTTGLNISGHGVSASIRTRIGAFSTEGFTLHTGFKGLTYRGTWFSGRLFNTRSVFSIKGLINLVSMTVLFLIKVAIIVLVFLGLVIVSTIKFLFRLITGFRKPEAIEPAMPETQAAAPVQPPDGNTPATGS